MWMITNAKKWRNYNRKLGEWFLHCMQFNSLVISYKSLIWYILTNLLKNIVETGLICRWMFWLVFLCMLRIILSEHWRLINRLKLVEYFTFLNQFYAISVRKLISFIDNSFKIIILFTAVLVVHGMYIIIQRN